MPLETIALDAGVYALAVSEFKEIHSQCDKAGVIRGPQDAPLSASQRVALLAQHLEIIRAEKARL